MCFVKIIIIESNNITVIIIFNTNKCFQSNLPISGAELTLALLSCNDSLSKLSKCKTVASPVFPVCKICNKTKTGHQKHFLYTF